VTAWVEAQENLHLSVISIGELRKGFSLLRPSKRRTDLERWFDRFMPLVASRILPVTQDIASRWGALSAARQLKGRPLSVTDGLIAATALEHDLAIVTRNVKDFAGLGLALIDPWEI
jgi:predicted nucleic acid-binding protein